MPTTIDSAGITFNDATSLTSANIGTAQLVNGSVIASKLGTTEQKQIAKAWVNFNGTTSPGTIRAQYNVSSVTKNGTGDYTITFTTPMSDANYSTIISGNGTSTVNVTVGGTRTALTGSCRIDVGSVGSSPSGIPTDRDAVSVAIFGN